MSRAEEYFTEARKQKVIDTLTEEKYDAALGVANMVDRGLYTHQSTSLLACVDRILKCEAALKVVESMATHREVEAA